MSRVVIVGAGISGLSLAYRLYRADPTVDVTVLEARERPGGTMWTERRDGFQVEIGPNGFLDNKSSTIALCQDAKLDNHLVAASESAHRNRFLFLDGRLQKLPTGPGSFLRSNLLSWRGKARLLLEPFRRPNRSDEDESIDSFVRRRLGDEPADLLADALVTGIHAGDPARLSVRATFPRLVRLEQEYGSLVRGAFRVGRQKRREAAAAGRPRRPRSTLWSFRDGMRVLVETLAGALPRPPIQGVSVRAVERAADQAWLVRADGRDAWPADAVVLTCPAYTQAEILAGLDLELAGLVGAIAYNRVAVAALGYRRTDVPGSFDGFGFIAPQRTRRDILGAQWCSSIFPGRAPDGTVLLRVLCGGWNRPDVVDWDDDRLLRAVRDELKLAMGIEAAPVFHHLVRWQRAIPQYNLGHLERVSRIEQLAGKHPGLFLAGNAYHGVAVNDCTEQSDILSGRVIAFLRRPPHVGG